MSKKKFIPPRPSIREYISDNLTDVDFKNIKYSNDKNIEAKIQKHTDKYRKLAKQEKYNKRSEWFWTKGNILINTILALIAAITGVIGIILQLVQ